MMDKKWRPSNGSEGDWFMAQFCDLCRKDDPEKEILCEIIYKSMAYEVDDPEYPKEWVEYDNPESPMGTSVKCTAFESEGRE
jgi:hypothetical protein